MHRNEHLLHQIGRDIDIHAVSRKTLLVLILSVVAVTLASTATAAPKHARLHPHPHICPPVQPRLGIHYTVIPGYGYRVNYVMWGQRT